MQILARTPVPSFSFEPPRHCGALCLMGGHRAHCACGWASDCYAMLSDAQRALDVHERRAECDALGTPGLSARSAPP